MSVTATLCTACVAVATVSGGLFAQAAPSLNAGVKQVELVDDYIVVHSPVTSIPTAPQSALMQAFVAPPSTTLAPAPTDPPTTVAAPAPAPAAAKVQPPAPAPAPAPAATTPPETTSPRYVKPATPTYRAATTHSQPPTTDGTYQRHNQQSTGNTQPSDDHGGDD